MYSCPHCETGTVDLEQHFQEVGCSELEISGTCDNCRSTVSATLGINRTNVDEERNEHLSDEEREELENEY